MRIFFGRRFPIYAILVMKDLFLGVPEQMAISQILVFADHLPDLLIHRLFQILRKLEADGEIGKDTWTALLTA